MTTAEEEDQMGLHRLGGRKRAAAGIDCRVQQWCDIDTLRTIARQVQCEFACNKTCKEQREDRVATQVRWLWLKASRETSERGKRGLQQAAWGLLRLLDRVAKMGRAPKHQPALKRIEAIKIEGET